MNGITACACAQESCEECFAETLRALPIHLFVQRVRRRRMTPDDYLERHRRKSRPSTTLSLLSPAEAQWLAY